METVTAQTPVQLDIEGGIARVRFDLPGEKVNKLSRVVMERLDEVLGELESGSRVEGAIFESGKDGVFIAGADVAEIQGVATREEAVAAIRAGQGIMDRIERLPFPTVAAIGGICLGGGTELALACRARIGSDHPRFQIGLPEVNLGILPAWGGTTRLPRLVGLKSAMDLILRGRGIDARKAERMGLLDRAVAHGELDRRAHELLAELREGKFTRRPRRRTLPDRLLEGNPLGRALLFSQAKKRVLGQTKGHYPAPLAALEVLKEGHGSKARSFELERERAAELITGPISKSLVHLFFLSEAAKKDSGVAAKDVAARDVELAGLLGAGTMGGGIARLLASRDIPVRLKDVSPEALGAGLRAARKIFDERRKRRRMTAWEVEQKMTLLTATLDWSGFRQSDAVLEAIVEDMEIKKSVLRELEGAIGPECLIGSNTSTLSITEMQSALARPERMAGFHFFNPVDRMPLIEVIRGDHTDDRTAASFVTLAKRLGKTPVVVQDGPGFLVNRILGPYLNEAGYLLLETGDTAGIDRAFRRFGMPMGPLRLLDEIGIDVAVKAGKTLTAAFGDRSAPAGILPKLADKGALGKKSGKGFYVYEGKKERVDDSVPELVGAQRSSLDAAAAVERGVSLMIAEAARCLDEAVVRSPGELDLAMVMGTGFPPFRGGLLRHADTLGLARVVEILEKWKARLGTRFDPPAGLVERARSGKNFYPPLAL